MTLVYVCQLLTNDYIIPTIMCMFLGMIAPLEYLKVCFRKRSLTVPKLSLDSFVHFEYFFQIYGTCYDWTVKEFTLLAVLI